MATFTTYADNQTGMDFHIVQGERELARDCRSLGRFKLKGLPPRPAGMVKVNVRYQIDANGLLQVTAREDSTGASAGVEVQPMHGMTDDQVETMLKASYDHAREDFDNRHLADLKVELGIMLRATESRLPDVTDELDRESQRDIRDAIASAKAAIANEDLAAARTARDELERATMPLAALLMDHVAQDALAGKRLGDV
jgi:molecular chaperone HscA